MFGELRPASRRPQISRGMSIVFHGAILFILLRSPNPIFVKPAGTLYGKHGTATQLVYLPRMGTESPLPPPDTTVKKLVFHKSHGKPKAVETAAEPAVLAGSPSGSLSSGLLTGHEVRPAFPVIFPDPVVARSEIPNGTTGDVVIEVTIDERGIVTATKILQPFGYGIEDKVLAVVRNWRFSPATMDGVAIPSQQDVHFHFPS